MARCIFRLLPSCYLAILPSFVHSQIATEFAAKGSPLGLESDLEQAIIAFMEEDPGDVVGLETAKVLKDGSVPIRLSSIPDLGLGAIYEQSDKAIIINLNTLASRYSSGPVGPENRRLVVEGIRATWERNPESLRAFAAEMAPLLVHELRHALYARKLGPHPSSIEEEMACHGYQALFISRRLRKDPEYIGIRQYDSLVREYLEEPPATGKEWWRDPFPLTPIQDIARAAEKVNEEFPGRFRLNPLSWLHVRSLSDGFAHFRLVFVSTYPQEKFSLETDPKLILAELRGVGKPRKGERLHKHVSRIHRLAVDFFDDPKRVQGALDLFEKEWVRLEALIKEENPPKAP